MKQNLIPTLIKDINPGSQSSNPTGLTSVNGELYFASNDGNSGIELWKSNGTAEGTILLKDIATDPRVIANPRELTDVNGTLFFAANEEFGTQNVSLTLFKSDGTSEGTVEVFKTSGRSPILNRLTESKGLLFFNAGSVGVSGFSVQPFRSDGTQAGTFQLKTFDSGPQSIIPNNFTDVNGTVFFTASLESSNNELWKTDGTSEGTVLVKDINLTGSSNPGNLVNVNGTLFFAAIDEDFVFIDAPTFLTNGNELWKSDGSEAGTTLIKDINPGEASSNPSQLTDVNGSAYFTANNGTNGRELWKSDGTESGTVLVKDIVAGSGSSNPDNLTNVNGTLFFTVNDGSNGTELWKSNGTAGGTEIVADINPGANSSNPGNLTNVEGILYFTADDGSSGTELWKSDGTAQGTSIVGDINPGSASSNPGDLTNFNGQLYFSADDGVNGRELWGLTEDRGSNDDIFGVKDSDPSEFDNIPTKPNQVTIVPTETGDIELPRRFNTNRFNGVVAIDGANGTGGTSEGGADFAIGSAVLRDGGDGSENRWNFSGIELRNIAYINGRDGNDRITGSVGADNILGGGGNDDLRGGKGEDTIEGGAGDDLIRGRNDNDLLLGGSLINNTSDDDILEGGGKDDILDGQKGNDTLSGGAGKDKFVLSEDFGKDIITDFKLNRDEIINATEFTVLGVTLEDYAFKVSFNNTDDILQVNINGNKQARLESYLLNIGSNQAKPY